MTRNEILLIDVGRVPAEIGGWLHRGLPRAFNMPCRSGRPLPHPSFAWNARRRQYLADAVLARVDRGSSSCALALADMDLYVSSLNFVIGQGDPGRMQVPDGTRRQFEEGGIELIVQPTSDAAATYNRLRKDRRVVAALHLTC
jgi:predicted Zn-dependent protease